MNGGRSNNAELQPYVLPRSQRPLKADQLAPPDHVKALHNAGRVGAQERGFLFSVREGPQAFGCVSW